MMLLNNVLVGAAFIGLALYLNLRLFSSDFREFGDQHITFHLGNDQEWKSVKNDQFRRHNESEFQKIRTQLASAHKNVEKIIESAFPNLKGKEVVVETKKNWISFLGRYLGR